MKKAILAIAVLGILTGCVTKEVIYKKETAKDGTITETTTTTIDGNILTNKTVAASGSVQAFKLETTGGTTTGTALPNVVLGGGNSVYCSTPDDSNKPVFCYSRSASIFGSLFNASATGISYSYIGVQNETSAETEKRVNALKGLANDSTEASETNAETSAETTAGTTSSSEGSQ